MMNILLATMVPRIDFSIPFDLLFFLCTHTHKNARKKSEQK